MTALVRVAAAGPLTTLQDAGRFGWLRYGVPASGPVDAPGFAGACAALGAAAGPVAIEVSMGGLVLEGIEGAIGFALLGEGFAAMLDGVPIGGLVAGTLAGGQRLAVRDLGGHFGSRWATLAVAGVIECGQWLGSAATLARVGLGGGRLTAGEMLRIGGAAEAGPVRVLAAPPAQSGPIRVVIGPQQRYFSPESLDLLQIADFAASARFDRMGMVLDGPALVPLALDMLSSPLVRGSVQVNGEGAATVLTADHQPTGGYPRIATVISADLARLVRLPAGERFRFEAVTVSEAVRLARRNAVVEAEWLRAVSVAPGSLADRLFASNLIDGVVDAGEG
jgi:allophanate hydrolase